MSRIIRMSIVLGIVLATLGVSVAIAADVPSGAFERAVTTQQAVLTDSLDREIVPTASGTEARRVAESRAVAQATTTPVPTDSHERVQPGDGAGPIVGVEDTGPLVSLTDVLLAAAIGLGVVAAGVLLAGAIRRYPPRGHYPPPAHH